MELKKKAIGKTMYSKKYDRNFTIENDPKQFPLYKAAGFDIFETEVKKAKYKGVKNDPDKKRAE